MVRANTQSPRGATLDARWRRRGRRSRHPLLYASAINAYASFGTRRDVGPRVVDALVAAGHDVVALSEVNIDLLRREVRARIDAGIDVLVVVGGDGMVSLGTNEVVGTALPLAIVPCGTGNDLAWGLGIPLDDTDAAIRHLLNALAVAPRAIDAALVRHGEQTTWFAGVLSAGFDAVVNERANLMKRPRGKSRYTLAMLRELATFKPVRYGLLDLFILAPMSRFAFLRVFPKVFSGTHTNLPQVEITRCRSILIEVEHVIAYADGERIGPLPVQIDVVPGALLVCA